MNEHFIYCSKDNDNDMLFVELAGTSFCDGSYSISRKKSDVYVIELILEGTGTIIHNEKSYTASKGDFYILKKGDDHYYFSSPKNVKVFCTILFRPSIIVPKSLCIQ